jgi:hypothetical protein
MRKLLIEAGVILTLLTIAGVAIYVSTVHHSKSPWPAAGSYVQDVSRARGIQTEISVAVDPANPRSLFGVSNDSLGPAVRVYTSTDGGRSWSSRPGPVSDPNTCAWGDPAVAIASNGRQYVAYTEKSICAPGPDLAPYLVVASRRGPSGSWATRRVTRPAIKFGFDDKPAIAIDAGGRVYVAWSRLLRPRYQTTVLSSSADEGKTWSDPRVVDSTLVQPQLVTLAAGPARQMYVGGVDARRGVWIGWSNDGGKHFAVRQAAPLPGSRAATCLVFGKFVLAQQAVRCLGPNPTLTVTKNRVFLVYGTTGNDETQDVDVAAFDLALEPVWRGRVGPVETKKADQFWPVSAVDPKTQELWSCYYDTTGAFKLAKAWFSCTVSRDGKHWTKPVRPAREAASVSVLFEDARIYGFGDSGGYGGYTGLAAAGGVAYPMWIDTRDVYAANEEVFAARLPASAVRRASGGG